MIGIEWIRKGAFNLRGSIIKRGKKYSIVVQVEDEKGVKKPKWLSGYSTKKEAEADLPRILIEVQGGVFVDKKIGFSDYADMWMKHQKSELNKGSIKPSTYTTYEWVIKRLKARFLSVKIEKIKPIAIQDFLDSQELSATSVNYIYTILSMAFEDAVKLQLLVKNPCKSVTRPSRTKKKFKPLSIEQIKKLLDGSRHTIMYVPILLALSCGLRRGEICALEWSDLDFNTNVIYIRDGKTENSARAVTAPEYIMNELKRLRGIGKVVPMRPNHIYRFFVRIVKSLNLPDITFHDLRHLHCSILLMQGVPVTAVSARVGHSSKGFTLDTYGHLLPTMQEQASNAMDSFISNTLASAKK